LVEINEFIVPKGTDITALKLPYIKNIIKSEGFI